MEEIDFQYGAINKGYWSYEDMILQVEHCIGCLKTINGDKCEYLFLFDHSNNHDCIAPDALSPTNIRKNYSATQPKMRDSTILNETFLGLYDHCIKLKVGGVQHMSFTYSNPGPFYFDNNQRKITKYDTLKGNKDAYHPKPELIIKLKAKGIKNPKGNRKKLRELSKKNNIPI